MFSVLTLYFKTVDWSLTTRIKQRERNVVLSWAGVCGEGRNTSSPKNALCGSLVQARLIQKVLPQWCALLQVSCERSDQIFY